MVINAPWFKELIEQLLKLKYFALSIKLHDLWPLNGMTEIEALIGRRRFFQLLGSTKDIRDDHL